MIPHYQNRTLNYDNRINSQINQSLKKKYANLETINFTDRNADAEQVFTDLEKVLFLLFALFQEIQTYIFEAPNHADDRNNNKYYMEDEMFGGVLPSDASSEYGNDFDAFSESGSQYSSQFDEFSDNVGFSPNRADQTRTEAQATLGIFRTTLSKIFQQSLSLTKLVKAISPLFNFLNQPQVDSLKDLIKKIYELYYMTLGDVSELEEYEIKGKDQLLKSLKLIRENLITKNLIVLDKLIRSYNPIVTQGQLNSVNDDGSGGYTIVNGIDEGQYV